MAIYINTSIEKTYRGKVKLLADSSCDIFYVDGVDFESVPLTVSANGVDYVDNRNLNVTKMLNDLTSFKGRSYTSCPGAGLWLDSFGDADEIYVAAMTSGLSGTYNSARAARQVYLQSNPNARVMVFDTLTTGPQLRLFVEKLAAWIKAGRKFGEIAVLGKRYLSRTTLFFSIKSLHNFVQNGRISKTTESLVNTLGLKIIATSDSKGRIKVLTGCRDLDKTARVIKSYMIKSGYKGGRVAISHVENSYFAEELRKSIKRDFPGAEVLVYPAGGLCSYYAGCGGILIGCEC